jgi:cytochrome c551/c552
MNTRTLAIATILPIALVLSGCSKHDDSQAASTSTSSSSSASSGSAEAVSPYDQGARAGEQPIDESKVAQGEALFKSKGCSACHAFGTKLSCPDLNGVTMRRTAEWMKHQILHPEVMTKSDPISRGLFAQYSLQMPNQKLTDAEADAVIEFLKHKNHEAAEHH